MQNRKSRFTLKNQIQMLLSIFVTILLTCCATDEEWLRYQPVESMAGGYTSYELSKDTYQIYLITNLAWSRYNSEYSKRVANYLNFTAADLTLKKGYEYFVELNRSTIYDRALDPAIVFRNQKGYNQLHILTIKMTKGNRPNEIARSYNAREQHKLLGLYVMGNTKSRK